MEISEKKIGKVQDSLVGLFPCTLHLLSYTNALYALPPPSITNKLLTKQPAELVLIYHTTVANFANI